MKRLEVRIYGRVQGVFFRYNTELKAKKLGLKGWIRNEPDGTVKAVLEGDSDKLNDILEFFKEGPRLAKVEKVDFDFKDATKEFSDFEIRYSY